MEQPNPAVPLNGQAAATPEAPGVVAQITVTLTADGGVRVDGPLENLIMCFGLLESAKDAVRNYQLQQVQQNKKRIQVPALVGNLLSRARKL